MLKKIEKWKNILVVINRTCYVVINQSTLIQMDYFKNKIIFVVFRVSTDIFLNNLKPKTWSTIWHARILLKIWMAVRSYENYKMYYLTSYDIITTYYKSINLVWYDVSNNFNISNKYNKFGSQCLIDIECLPTFDI